MIPNVCVFLQYYVGCTVRGKGTHERTLYYHRWNILAGRNELSMVDKLEQTRKKQDGGGGGEEAITQGRTQERRHPRWYGLAFRPANSST